METFSLADAQRHLTSIVDNLTENPTEVIQIQVDGKPAAVILSADHYAKLKAQCLNREIDTIFKEFHETNVALSNK